MYVSKSFTLIETKDYTIRLEYNEDYVILHLPDIVKMNKGVFLDMKFRLEDWHKFFTTAGYAGIFAAVDPNNLKICKLLKMLEFKKKGHADNMDVYFYGEV
jgi:hypothetical protein